MTGADASSCLRKCVAVSGASGFVGSALVVELDRRGHTVLDVRRAALERMVEKRDAGDLLTGCRAAIHLAGRAHILHERDAGRSAIYRLVNRDTTLAFAEACARSGVNRFVFVSSIHVNGSASDRPFRPDDAPAPREPYAVSKLEAETGLWELSRRTGLEVVVVRPPLVYGPGAKANFLRLLKLSSLPLPLPLGGVSGRRSLISVWNLVDLLIRCIDHPCAAGHTLLAADGEDIGLPELVRSLAKGMGKRARLLYVPERLMGGAAVMLGFGGTFQKLADSLQVDSSETRRLLGWEPPVPLREGLERTARWYVESRSTRARD